jgi:hypothetical protein
MSQAWMLRPRQAWQHTSIPSHIKKPTNRARRLLRASIGTKIRNWLLFSWLIVSVATMPSRDSTCAFTLQFLEALTATV